MTTNPTKQHVDLFSETLRLAFADQGEGRAFLLLHGGAGPGSMMGLAGALAAKARVVVPTYPGFDGEPRPDRFARIDDLVLAHLALIERLGLERVVVAGNSVGGWIAAEMALRGSPRVAGVVLINAVGIEPGSPEHSIVDPAKIPVPELLKLSFHDPARFAVAPSSPEAAAVRVQNQRTLRVYAPDLFDPTLRGRLAATSTPALVVWGKSDRVVDVDYGRLFAESIPGSRFEVVPEAGHLPQIERLQDTARLIGDFAASL
jgi:pimeloyl-ACP methyl ester carboxylesterase